jgi:two-component system NarL family sensor kinase
MKTLYILLLAIIAVVGVRGQAGWVRKRDSLLNVLAKEKEDSNKVWTLLKLGILYLDNHPDSVGWYGKALTGLSEKIHMPKGIVNGLSMQAEAFAEQSRKEDALALDLQAVKIGEQAKLKGALANVYNNTAIIYNEMGDRSDGLDYYLKAAAIYEKENDTSSMAFIYANIAGVYNDLKEYRNGYLYSLKGVLLCRSLHQEHGLGAGMVNLGSSLIYLGRYDTALTVLTATLELAKSNNDIDEEIDILGDIDYAYEGLGKFGLIKDNATTLLSLARSRGYKDGECYGLFGLVDFYLHEKQYDRAGKYAMEAMEIAEKNKLTVNLREAYKEAGAVALARGSLKKFYHYNELKDSIENIIQSDKILKNTQELETKYSLNKKEVEIDDLNKQKKIQALELRQQSTMNWALSGMAVVLLLAGFLYRMSYRQKRILLQVESRLQQQRILELEREKQLMAAQSILQGQVEERTRLAKDLHDGLGSILSGAKYSFSHMKESMVITGIDGEAFERSMSMLDKSISELRRVAHNMMPESLMKFGLDTALKDFCQSIDQSGAIRLDYLSFEVQETSIPDAAAAAVYRIVQELVNNILKHAEARTALVQLIRKENTLSITVEDDGKGFDVQTLESSTGIGYLNLRNRVAYLNGTIDIKTEPGGGTSVNIEIFNIAV